MAVMVLVVNAVLYVIALSLSLAVLTPVPEGASRRVRAARGALACGGGAAMSVAITLSFLGHWFASESPAASRSSSSAPACGAR
jgi:hypothetical protein